MKQLHAEAPHLQEKKGGGEGPVSRTISLMIGQPWSVLGTIPGPLITLDASREE